MAQSNEQNIWLRGLQRLREAVAGHRKLVLALILILTGASLFGMSRLAYNHDLDVMLPADEQVRRTMQFLREANFSHDVILSLRLREGAHTPEDLQVVAEQLCQTI